jgi:dihydroorotate dehydrogenase
MSNTIYKIAKQFLFRFTPEQAHALTMHNLDWITQTGLHRLVVRPAVEDPIEVMGLRFPNTIGLAAGMDKDGEHVTAFGALGFGSVEVGTVTPKGQPGNPKPRCFRLIPEGAVINRMGFNNYGALQMVKNLQSARAFRNRGGILGINIGKNKVTPNADALSDYERCMERLYTSADYIAINISSPNTPNLRELQAEDELKHLLTGIANKRKELQEANNGQYVPIAVKIAPDLTDDGVLRAIDQIVAAGMDAVICTNTTIARDAVKSSPRAGETGGLSGRPLFERSTEVTRMASEHLKGTLPIIASGGVMTGDDAVAKVQAGAKIVQLYTGFIFNGPQLITDCIEAIADYRRKNQI